MQQASAIEEKIKALAEPYLTSLGLLLWGVELAAAGHRPVLRLFIDIDPDAAGAIGKKGVTVDDCALVSRHVSDLLDVEELFHGPYVLEVSSPGLDRRFFTPDQLQGYLGRPIDVRLARPVERRKHFRGTLDAVAGGRVTMTVDPGEKAFELTFDFSEAAKVRLIHAYGDISDGGAASGSPAEPSEGTK